MRDKIAAIQGQLERFQPVMRGLTRARNPFELRYLVMGRHDDRVQQFKQAVVELQIKNGALAEGWDVWQRKEIDLERTEARRVAEPTTREDAWTNREVDLDLAKLAREQQQLSQVMVGAFKEVLDLMAILDREYADLLPLTEEQLLEHEVDHWQARFTKQCTIDMEAHGKLGENNRDALECMPLEVQERILAATMHRVEERKLVEQRIAERVLVELAESEPRATQMLAPPVHAPLVYRKDAPRGYPAERVVSIDRAEIMIATLHRPGDQVWLSEKFYIPTGKNYVKTWAECPRAEDIGEWRNRLVLDALSLRCTHLLFVDDDLLVDEDALVRLYAHGLPVVGGWYPKKSPVIESASMVRLPDGSMGPVPLDAVGLVECGWSLTCGLTLYSTEVFRKLHYPWFLTTRKGTEDTYFTARAREAGTASMLDTSVRAVHVDKATGRRFALPAMSI